MAEKNKNAKSGKNGFLFGLLAVLAAFFIVAGIFYGAFYYIIHNNINHLADRYREQIQTIPVLRLALPEPPDPEDPKYLTEKEIRQKYIELLETRNDLKKRLEEAEKKVSELQQFKDQYDSMKAEVEQAEEQNREKQKQLEEQAAELEELQRGINEQIARGDTEGFKEYFEQIDPETAQRIYSEIVENEQIEQKEKEYAKIFESMDPSAAAAIFEELGSAKIDLVANTLLSMKKEIASEILAAMDAAYASKVVEKLSDKITDTERR